MSEEKRDIKVICWKCDKRFTVELGEIEQPRVIIRKSDGGSPQTSQARGKTYIVPCPYCQADNEIKV